jgi:hypothetical protein
LAAPERMRSQEPESKIEIRNWELASRRGRCGIDRERIRESCLTYCIVRDAWLTQESRRYGQHKNDGASERRGFGMAADHGAIHGGLASVTLARGRLSAVLGVRIVGVFGWRVPAHGTHAVGATGHGVSLIGRRPSWRPKQDYRQKADQRLPSVSGSAGMLGRWLHIPKSKDTAHKAFRNSASASRESGFRRPFR